MEPENHTESPAALSAQRFQVDLRGLVELLSKNLYSGPQVYLREVLQNGIDAITARRELEPNCPASVRLEPWEDGTGLTITDTGVGLSAAQAEEFLATIGRTSKRDELFGEGRAEYLGQFGIGLLACFLIADEVEVVSRSCRPGAVPVRWVGYADGTFSVSELLNHKESGAADGEETVPIGTSIRLQARTDAAHWVSEESIVTLATEYGAFLPVEVSVKVRMEGSAERVWRRITLPELPWKETYSSPQTRRAALVSFAQQTLGFTPLDVIELEVPLTGTSGVAYVLPAAVSPGSGKHRVYVKNMLVSAREDTVMPEWGFFVRAVLNSENLTPTASREALRDDEYLLLTRQAIDEQLKTWIRQIIDKETPGTRQFIQTHHLALRAVALDSADMLEVVAGVLPFETTFGAATLEDVKAHSEVVRYTATTEAYQRVAPVARAQGLHVVNGGYVYDSDLLSRLANQPGWEVQELQSEDLAQKLEEVTPGRELEVAAALIAAREALAEADCDVILRSFAPAEVPAVLLVDNKVRRAREFVAEREQATGSWGGLIGSFAVERAEATRTLVLNDANDTVGRLLAAPTAPLPPGGNLTLTSRDEAFRAGTRTMYLLAVMLSGEGLSGRESTALSESLGTLLDAAFG